MDDTAELRCILRVHHHLLIAEGANLQAIDGQECHINLRKALRNLVELWNQQGIASKVDREITRLQHIRDLWDAMLARYSFDGDRAKSGGFPGIHLDDVGKANLACR